MSKTLLINVADFIGSAKYELQGRINNIFYSVNRLMRSRLMLLFGSNDRSDQVNDSLVPT
jgi:hypothetical protein